MLPPESTLIAAVDVTASRGLLAELAERGGLDVGLSREILERTRRAYLGMSLSPAMPPLVSMVAVGAFGPAALELRLSFGRSWGRRTLDGAPAGRSEPQAGGGGPGERSSPLRAAAWQPSKTYWERRGSGLQVASPRHGVVILTNGRIAELLRRLERPAALSWPLEARDDLRQADLFVYFPTLPSLEAAVELSRLPIRSIWLAARSAENDFLISAVFTLDGVANERAVERLFRLLIPVMLRRARVEDPVGKLKALELEVSPERVRVDNLRLSAEEVMGFLSSFIGVDIETEGL